MPRTYEGSTNRRGRHAFAWSALAAITLLLAAYFGECARLLRLKVRSGLGPKCATVSE